MRRHLASWLALWAACSSTPSAEELRARTPEAPAKAKVARGTRAIDLAFDPNGLCWDTGERALYLVDLSGNRIMRWTDRRGFQVAASLPKPRRPGSTLGGIARLPDGRTVVARAGAGKDSTLFEVSEVHGARALSALPGERRRVGVSVDLDEAGDLYVASVSGSRGHVSKVDLAEADETDLPFDDLEQPFGIAVVGNVLYVSDRKRGEIQVMSLRPLSKPHAVAQLASPGLMAPGPASSVLVASRTGAVWQLAADGRLLRLLTSQNEVRGIAWDPTGKRLFFAEHDTDDSDGIQHRLQILPLAAP